MEDLMQNPGRVRRRQLGIGLVAFSSSPERSHQCMVGAPAIGAGDVSGGQIETHEPRTYAVGDAGLR
jgi:hypothetical protein